MVNMVYYIISLLGEYTGALLAYKIPEEIKQGKKYFNILILILLPVIGLYSIYYFFSLFYLIIGLVLGFLIRKEYLYFGLISNNVFFASLVFLYGMPYGTLEFNKNKKLKNLNINIIYFLIGIGLSFFLNIYSLAGGALIGIFADKIVHSR